MGLVEEKKNQVGEANMNMKWDASSLNESIFPGMRQMELELQLTGFVVQLQHGRN